MLSVCLILVWFNLGLVIHSSTINYFDFSFKPSIIFFGSMLDLRWGLIQRQDLIFWKDTHREIFFEILSNQPEIRFYLPFSDWFGSKRTSVLIQINRKMVNTIWFRVDSIRLQNDFSVCLNRIWIVFLPIAPSNLQYFNLHFLQTFVGLIVSTYHPQRWYAWYVDKCNQSLMVAFT